MDLQKKGRVKFSDSCPPRGAARRPPAPRLRAGVLAVQAALLSLAALPLERFISDGYSFLVEMLFVASRRGNRIAEVPITFVERRVGESKISKGVLLESAIMPWRLIGNPDTAQKAPVSRT